MRLRDFIKKIEEKGWDLPVLGSTGTFILHPPYNVSLFIANKIYKAAQSIGGLVATDLHSTGRNHGFLSQQVCFILFIWVV
jgi:hypothetical protein